MKGSRKDVPMSAIVRESAAKWRCIKPLHFANSSGGIFASDMADELPNPLPVATTFHTDIYPPTVAEMRDVMLRGALEWLSTKERPTILSIMTKRSDSKQRLG
jgi:hypothetical protein